MGAPWAASAQGAKARSRRALDCGTHAFRIGSRQARLDPSSRGRAAYRARSDFDIREALGSSIAAMSR